MIGQPIRLSIEQQADGSYLVTQAYTVLGRPTTLRVATLTPAQLDRWRHHAVNPGSPPPPPHQDGKWHTTDRRVRAAFLEMLDVPELPTDSLEELADRPRFGRVDDVTRARILRDYDTGLVSQAALCRDYGISQSTLRRWLKARGRLRTRSA